MTKVSSISRGRGLAHWRTPDIEPATFMVQDIFAEKPTVGTFSSEAKSEISMHEHRLSFRWT